MAKNTYGPKEVCHRAGISSRQLNYWKLIGVIKPKQELHGTKTFHRYRVGNDSGKDLIERARDQLRKKRGAL